MKYQITKSTFVMGAQILSVQYIMMKMWCNANTKIKQLLAFYSLKAYGYKLL